MNNKKRSLGFTGNSLTVQGTKRVKSVEESANRIVGEPKGGMLNVKNAAFGSIESDAALDTSSTGGSNRKINGLQGSAKTTLAECCKCKKIRVLPPGVLIPTFYCAFQTWVRLEDAHCEYEGNYPNSSCSKERNFIFV